jgi:hypothetical protein
MAKNLSVRGASARLVLVALALAAGLWPRSAAAEKVLTNIDGFEVFTDGRAGGYGSWVYGQGLPAQVYINNYNGVAVPFYSASGGGFAASHQQGAINDPTLNFPAGQPIPPNAGTINMFRVRSGFITNVFGFGVRNQLSPSFKFTAYLQLWMFVESEGRQKNVPNYLDARQGYAKVEGPWGSFLAGRTRALFSRGATDIDVLYAHKWGVGFPGTGNIDSKGPTVGQLGFGVHGSGFAPGLIYGTPDHLGGFHLDIGAFDPIQLPSRGWTRTTWPRGEAEATLEEPIGNVGKFVLFVNGAYQNIYKEGQCPTPGTPPLPCETNAGGVGYGGRLELGPVHIGLAGDWGKGLGLNYALESTDASQDQQGNLRFFDSYYAQLQVVAGKFDLFTGAGIERVFLTNYDKTTTVADPRDPRSASGDPAVVAQAAQIFPFAFIKNQVGVNWGVVYNATPNLHFDLDFFRAEANWYAVNGQRPLQQVVYVSNGGMVVNW